MNITIALSLNFPYTYLKPYLKSFIANVSSDLFLITDLSREQIPLTSNKLHIVNFSELAKKYKVANLTPYNLKPVLFYLYLKELNKDKKYNNALLTDVDVIFQDDPFSIYEKNYTENKLILGEERHFYKNCQTNSIWYNQGYASTFKQVEDKKILNCGVTIGPIKSLIEYQKKVAEELSIVLARQDYFAYDQVILNYFTYVTKDLEFKILPHGNDFIVHLSQEDEITDLSLWIKDNIIYNPYTNNPFVIIHQFDKKKGLKEFVVSKYE
jgi:hypothetical protein